MFPTIEEAKTAAENRAFTNYHDHAYVYTLDGQFGAYSHPEDRYVSTYTPAGSKIIAHGKGTITYDPERTATWVWGTRANTTTEEFDVLSDALGLNLTNELLNLFDGD